MDFEIFSKNLRQLKLQRNYSFCLNMFFGLVITVLLLISLKNANVHTTVVVPATLNAPVAMTNTGVDESYLIQWTDFIASLKLNITPDTVAYKQKALLAYIDSSKYGEMKSLLINEQESVKEKEVSMTFFPKKTEVIDSNTLTVNTKGLVRVYIGEDLNREFMASYQVKYNYVNGRLLLTGFKEVNNV
jgi:type IV conjugative transfer system protein TraE